MDNLRGMIRNRRLANQVRDYSGLRFGNITPTDIDGLIEYHGRGYVIIEIKHGYSEIPFGQRLALERLCDDLQEVKPTLLVICRHDGQGDIDVATTIVSEFRYKARWREREVTTRELVGDFVGYLDDSWVGPESQRHCYPYHLRRCPCPGLAWTTSSGSTRKCVA